jgi:hypothetical protein
VFLLSKDSSYFKVISRMKGFIGGGRSLYRIMDTRNGKFMTVTVDYIFNNIGQTLFAGRCFVPTALDYPILQCHDGDKYKLPVVDQRTGKCVENDTVIILFELVKDGVVWGYEVTEYVGGLHRFSLEQALTYEKVGFFNAEVSAGRIKPLADYVFPRKSL